MYFGFENYNMFIKHFAYLFPLLLSIENKRSPTINEYL